MVEVAHDWLAFTVALCVALARWGVDDSIVLYEAVCVDLVHRR